MKYISMLNPYSFYYLWQSNVGKDYITSLINGYLNIHEEYILLDYFNKSFNNVRSYLIFESNNNIVLIDFIINNRVIDDDLAIIMVLKCTSCKNIRCILFNNIIGKNKELNEVIYVYQDKSYLFANNYELQLKINKELTNYLYSMPADIYRLYSHEEELIDNRSILC